MNKDKLKITVQEFTLIRLELRLLVCSQSSVEASDKMSTKQQFQYNYNKYLLKNRTLLILKFIIYIPGINLTKGDMEDSKMISSQVIVKVSY